MALVTAAVILSVIPGTDFMADLLSDAIALRRSAIEDLGRPACSAAAETSLGRFSLSRLFRMAT